MTASELAQDIQFTVAAGGTVTAVVLTPKLWQRIAAALEDAEDRALVQALHTQLALSPTQSGALRWADVADEWT